MAKQTITYKTGGKTTKTKLTASAKKKRKYNRCSECGKFIKGRASA